MWFSFQKQLHYQLCCSTSVPLHATVHSKERFHLYCYLMKHNIEIHNLLILKWRVVNQCNVALQGELNGPHWLTTIASCRGRARWHHICSLWWWKRSWTSMTGLLDFFILFYLFHFYLYCNHRLPVVCAAVHPVIYFWNMRLSVPCFWQAKDNFPPRWTIKILFYSILFYSQSCMINIFLKTNE